MRSHEVRPWRYLALLTLLLGILAISSLEAADLDVDLNAYRDAADRGAVGTVTGRASALAPKPSAPDQPVSGIEVVLVPRSSALLLRLEEIKRRARASTGAYVDAVPEVQKAEQDLETRLGAQKAGDLVRHVTTGADGKFLIRDVPSGDWLVIASRSVFVAKRPRLTKPATSARELFDPPSNLVGYSGVTMWVRELRVTPGEIGSIELTDRDPWLSGVAEKRHTPPRKLRPLFE